MEIVKILHSFKLPSEIAENPDLYKENHGRVVEKLKSLGGQKRGKNADNKLIDEYIEALSFYNNRLKLVKNVLDQQNSSQEGQGISYKHYSTCDELVEKLKILCGSREIGNNSAELINEIVSILDILLNKGILNKDEHKIFFNKWCY